MPSGFARHQGIDAIMRSLAVLLSLIAAAPAAAQQTPSDSTRLYELHEVEVLPRPQNAGDFTAALAQAYPAHLRDAGVGGTVQVGFVVGPDGEPTEVRVLSSPDTSFDAPSVQAVSLLRFTPAQVQGRPVAVRVEQPITWRAEVPVVAVSEPPARAKERVWELSEVEELPRPANVGVFQEALAREAARLAEHGTFAGAVQVRFRIETDGTTSNVTVTRADHRALVAPTLRALQVLRFRPARVNGRPVAAWAEQPISWVMPEGAPNLAAPLERKPRWRTLSDW